MKTHEEMVAEAEALRSEGTELDDLVPVRARVAKDVRAVYSFRLTFSELARITEAATERGMTVSDFIRLASLSVANGDRDLAAGERTAAVLKIQDAVQELARSLGTLPGPPTIARSRSRAAGAGTLPHARD